MTGSTPRGDLSAARIAADVYVVVVEGTIPASESQVYDGKVLNRFTVLVKKSTTSSCGL